MTHSFWPLSNRPAAAAHEETLSIALVSVHGDPLIPVGAEEAGGQNVYVREVARALAARGHRVTVFTRGRACEAAEAHELGDATVVRLPAGPTGFISRNHLFPHLPAFIENVCDYARRERLRFDLVHTNYWLSGWVGMRLARLWDVPQTHTHHSLGAVKFATTGNVPPYGKTRLDVEDALSSLCDHVVATSPQEVESLARYYTNRARAQIIPCGVDDALFYPVPRAAARAELGLPQDTHLLAYAGRFDPQKGIDTFVAAAGRVASDHPIHLVFAGGFDPAAHDGAEFRRIQALVTEAGLAPHATFLGKVPQTRLPLVYSAADVSVIPSHYESFGLVAIEAMGCGTPVVASEVGGLRHCVRHEETGLLVPAKDEVAFAGAIARLLADDALRARLGRAGERLVAERFTWTAVAEQLEGMYLGMVAKKRHSRSGRVG